MAQDDLTLTIRVHDPLEKADPEMSASWGTIKVPRKDIILPVEDFVNEYVVPALEQVKNLKLKTN